MSADLADRTRLREFVASVIDRCAGEPDLDDFLLWWGGTLEYWLHIAASSVGQRSAVWAARSEVPYITGAPASASKSDVKWADGAVLWADGLLALLEVKSIPMRTILGSSAQHIPRDLAALMSSDWTRTLAHERGTDTYTDIGWWKHRGRARRVWGIAIAVVHGHAPLGGAAEAFESALVRGHAALTNRQPSPPPPWLATVSDTLAAPLLSNCVIGSGAARGAFSAWAGRITDARA